MSERTRIGIPTGDPIRIEGASGLFAGLAEVRLNPSLSRIEVTLPGTGGDLNFLSGSFRIVGVRMDASGKSGAQSITASLNSSANNYFLGTTTATVINSLSPGIGSFAIGARPGQTSLGTATVRADGTISQATGSFILSEGCASCWRTRTQSGGSNFEDLVANGSNIRLTFNNMPAGMTLNLMANTEASLSATLSNSTITTAANTTTISFTATNLSAVETPEIDYTVVVSGGAPFTPGAITATATLAPIGAGLDSSGLPREDQGYPTFAEADLGPITLVNIVPGPKKVPPQITSQ